MKVKELIRMLEKYPGEAEIFSQLFHDDSICQITGGIESRNLFHFNKEEAILLLHQRLIDGDWDTQSNIDRIEQLPVCIECGSKPILIYDTSMICPVYRLISCNGHYNNESTYKDWLLNSWKEKNNG